MIEFYPEVRLVHVYAALASGALLLVRGLAVHAGAKWPTLAPLRYSSYAIDTALLTAALMLAEMLRQYPFVQPWITAKVLLLGVYVALGSFALKQSCTRAVRLSCWVAGLATYGFIVSIARIRHPFGFLYPFLDGGS